MTEAGSSKSNPWKPAAYRRLSADQFSCVIKTEGPRIGDRWEAMYPINTPERIRTANAYIKKYSRHKRTQQCLRAGFWRNMCKAMRKEKVTDWEIYDEHCK